jgi:iron complex outermembrane receptor protein
VNNLGGEGHMTSIRQPISTAGVYLFLEDGVPTRPTGFFNHNGLYEVDMAQSDRIEVLKGPGTALYGSDAIGGVINNLTDAPAANDNRVSAEAGSYDWTRLLGSISNVEGDNGYRLNLLTSHNGGYRDNSGSDRTSATLRVDNQLSAITAKTILSYTDVHQEGASTLGEEVYHDKPTTNYYEGDVAFRDVKAVRLSSELGMELNSSQDIVLTPFYRYNDMDLMPSWMITYDPNVAETHFETYGMLGKWRTEFADKGLVIVGTDIDYTPSTYDEYQITVQKTPSNTAGYFYYSDYQKTGVKNYDFDADQTSISPYIHSEWQALTDLRLTAGVRYDSFRVNYDNNLSTVETYVYKKSPYIRPPSQTVTYEHTSPKFGAVYDLDTNWSVFANYLDAFRAPTVGNLFRAGSSSNTTNLEPVKAENIELGIRGNLTDNWNTSASIYQLTKKDDIVNIINNNSREVVNAGKTQHEGIELELDGQITSTLSLNAAWTWTRQTYENFSAIKTGTVAICGKPNCSYNVNYDGNDIAQAPDQIGNVQLKWQPAAMPKLGVEWEVEKLGSYYIDPENNQSYDGYLLMNLRASYQVTPALDIYSRITNLQDRLYSVYTDASVNTGAAQYRPGYDRAFYLGARWEF